MTDREFKSALGELTGCTAGQSLTARLLAERGMGLLLSSEAG